jgi:hypothetical protein
VTFRINCAKLKILIVELHVLTSGYVNSVSTVQWITIPCKWNEDWPKFAVLLCGNWIHGSAASIATDYGQNCRGIRVQAPVGSRIFTSQYCPDWLWGRPSLLGLQPGRSFHRVKWPKRDTDHSLPISAEVKHRNKFTLPVWNFNSTKFMPKPFSYFSWKSLFI